MTDPRREPVRHGNAVEDVPTLERDESQTASTITIETDEVTAWCPFEGTADYYDVTIEYLPDGYVVELMSLRDYFQSFRDREISHEAFTDTVFEHLVTLLDPTWLRVTAVAPPRYGLETTCIRDTRNDHEGHPPEDAG
ncbi:MAG: NADPH-dependent 7-cyano-7-deazaguanine reductase [Halobacteriaceae archaeon]